MSAQPPNSPKFSRFPAALDLKSSAHTDIALVAALAAVRGRRRDGTAVTTQVSELAAMFSGNANHCWRTVRGWVTSTVGDVVAVAKNDNGTQRFDLQGGRFIKFPTWALTSGVLTRVGIVALLGLCSGLSYASPTAPVKMTRRSLRNRTGLAERTVTRALVELEQAGVISRMHRFDDRGRRKATAYTINWEPGAREVDMDAARECTGATARECTNNSEDLFSEVFSSEPPPPPQSAETDLATTSEGEDRQVKEGEPVEVVRHFVDKLQALNGTWASLLSSTPLTKRDHTRIRDALGTADPAVAARFLEDQTSEASMHGVWRAASVLPFRLGSALARSGELRSGPSLNQAQVQMRSRLAGEIAAGERCGTIDDWQHLIDDLA